VKSEKRNEGGSPRGKGQSEYRRKNGRSNKCEGQRICVGVCMSLRDMKGTGYNFQRLILKKEVTQNEKNET
jgi:hypothetical protein